MTIEEYFGDWNGIVDINEANRIMKRLKSSKIPICPMLKDVFRAFRLCSFHDLRCCIISQDPYPEYRNGKPIATGLAFANPSDTPKEKYSPSLEVLRESVMDFSGNKDNVNFDASLEKWEEQGVLLLNTALSCEKGKPDSHALLWRPFITSFITNLRNNTFGLVYVLMGSAAQTLEPYIDNEMNLIIKTRHPAYYVRTHTKFPSDVWQKINDILHDKDDCGIKWYN